MAKWRLDRRPRRQWSWLGASAFALTLCIGLGWAVGFVLAISGRSPPITDNVQTMLTAIGSVLAGAIATFIGAQIQVHHQERELERNPDIDTDIHGRELGEDE